MGRLSNTLIQQQQQTAVQQQRLAAYQLQQVKLLSMPLAQLEEAVRAEIDDNPALETPIEETNSDDMGVGNETNEDIIMVETNGDDIEESFEKASEREEIAELRGDAFDSIGRDDRMPTFGETHTTAYEADYEEMVYGNTISFYDSLREQMGELSLDDKQQNILEYLIGSIDDDGLFRKDSSTIADELAIYHNLDVEKKDVEEMLSILQSFDPAGIGAHSLQECLLLQIDRKLQNIEEEQQNKQDVRDTLYNLKQIISRHFQQFTRKQWQQIARSMRLNEEQMRAILKEVKRLNPRPGASLGETMGRSLHQITPDFIVESDDSGYISISLNKGNLPSLVVSPSFNDMVKEYHQHRQTMTKTEREAYKYAIDKVDSARMFIEAINLRRRNMLATMQVIVNIQRDYFLSGDEGDLKPMVLKDVAERCELNISTVSRVTNLKYIQTRWGIIPMRMLFSEHAVNNENGEELSTKKIQQVMKEIIESEDKKHPIGDEALKNMLVGRGFPIARRTVAKYREKLGIPVARLRKEY